MTALLILLCSTDIAPAAVPNSFDTVVAPFFRTYCDRCHDGKVQKGEFRLDTLSRDFTLQADAERWSEIRVRMNSGEMPPKAEPQPRAEQLAIVVE